MPKITAVITDHEQILEQFAPLVDTVPPGAYMHQVTWSLPLPGEDLCCVDYDLFDANGRLIACAPGL